MMLFTKEWFSIDESIEILNKLTKNKANLTHKYIKDLFLEENIRLCVKLKLISCCGAELFSNNRMYDTPFSLIDEHTNRVIEKQSISIRDHQLNTNLEVRENGEFFGGGNLWIIPDNCSILEKFNTFSILVNSFSIFLPNIEIQNEIEGEEKLFNGGNDVSVELYSENPIQIDFKDIVIYIDDLLDTIKLINGLTEHSIKYLSSEKKNIDVQTENTQLKQQSEEIVRLQAKIIELEKQLQMQQSLLNDEAILENTKGTRISQAQRDIFTLLVVKNYQDYQTRNALFEAINTEMREYGVITSNIKYPTLDKLIDEDIRLHNLSPFPPKQK